jgi:Acetyltransferases, including N-acetylases of ribosomal proteins
VALPELTEDKIELNSFLPEDAPQLAAIGNNPKVAQFLRDNFPSPYTLQQAEDFISMLTLEREPSVFAVRFNDELAGVAGVKLLEDVQRKTAEIGFWLGEEYWGKGIATEVCRQLIVFAFTYYDIIRLEAEVASPNKASVRVLKKNGFKREAVLRKGFHKNGLNYDLLIFGLLKEELANSLFDGVTR